jgi:hypothetical protein
MRTTCYRIYDLYNDAVNSSDYIVFNDRMFSDNVVERMRKEAVVA